MPGSQTGGGPPVDDDESAPPLELVSTTTPLLLEPGSPLLEPDTTPEVVEDEPGSPVVDVPVDVPVAVTPSVVVGLLPVVTPFDSDPADGSVALPASVTEPLLVDPPLLDPLAVTVAVPVPVPSPPGRAGSPHETRKNPKGATHDDLRDTVPNIRTGYAE
jgi:hypothetical protein